MVFLTAFFPRPALPRWFSFLSSVQLSRGWIFYFTNSNTNEKEAHQNPHRLTQGVFVRAYMTYYPPKPILRLGYQGTLQLSTWRTRGLEDLLDLLPEELETALDQEKENAQGNERPMKTKFQSTGKRYRFYISNLRKRKVWNLPTNVQVKLKCYWINKGCSHCLCYVLYRPVPCF